MLHAENLMLEDLNSERWEKYVGAYGNIQGFLEKFVNDPDNKDMAENVYQSLNHQMTFYPANYLVIPYLVEMLEKKMASDDVKWVEYCLFNVGMTLASKNIVTRHEYSGFKPDKDVKKAYRKSLKKLKKLSNYFYKIYKGQLTHKSESLAARLCIKGIRLPVYLFVIYMAGA